MSAQEYKLQAETTPEQDVEGHVKYLAPEPDGSTAQRRSGEDAFVLLAKQASEEDVEGHRIFW